MTQLRDAALAWRAEDPDPATRARLDELLATCATDPTAAAELADAFSGPLRFGTAGLRGALGPGPARMNQIVVGRAAAGLASYLVASGLAGGTVLIGYDARHNSQAFATESAALLAGAGLRVALFSGPVPTPVVAFGIRHLGAVAGVVVTASHNPPQDNGYKVYLGDGSQIVPPADREIAAAIEEAGQIPFAALPRSTDYELLDDSVLAAYVARAGSLVEAGAPRALTWAYTALHGVGTAVVERVAAAAGFGPAHQVLQQAQPDPDFPTVAFPNPEEPGAIDLTLAEAARVGADVAVANDPDADRCAVALPTAQGWRMLSGDELGFLLADDTIRAGRRGTLACSVVSSTMLASMAAAHTRSFVTTLTGFKWIGRVPDLAFGYEEAIGYCTDAEAVSDKDGISTLVRVLAMAAAARAAGTTLLERLDEIQRSYGLHLTSQLSFRVEDLTLISSAMQRVRVTPPTSLAGEPVTVTDLALGSAELPPTDGLLFSGERVRVVVRPSGTEPKLKCYLQVRLDPSASTDLDVAGTLARGIMASARADMAAALGL